MKNSRVIVIANHKPLDNNRRIRERMSVAQTRADRIASRFPHLDLPSIQRGVNENMKRLYLTMDGRYMDLFDLMNFLQNQHKPLLLSSDNVTKHYSLSNNITLNGIYLYQYLLGHGYDPLLIHNFATSNLEETLREKPLAVCISSNFIFLDDIKHMASEIKRIDPNVAVIVGGMLIKRLLDPGDDLTSQYKNSLTAFHEKVDAFIIEAQGEQTLIKVLDSLPDGGRLEHVPNLAIFDDGGKVKFTSREQEDLPIDETAISWDKIPKAYLRKTLPVNTSRGCHFRCRFCTFRWLFPQVHYKSMAVLKKELRLINQLGFVEHIRFTDDNFTGSKAKLKKVLEMMIQEDFDFSWSSYARASALEPRLVKMMKKAGCEFVYLGIESGSPAILKNMDKKLDRDESINAIKMLSDEGIQSRGSFIVGYPGETHETFLQTVSLINESGLPYYIPYLFIYSKRALVHEDRDKFGLVGTGQTWKQDTMDAVEASRLMTKLIHIVPESYNDGMTYIEEIYNLLLGKGYDHGEILELFRLKRELQLAVEERGSQRPYHPKVNEILVKMESLIK
ncbi:MAG: hypothetical protein AMK69_04515 [Nitrospira bacterium SG8_3]|nr:MAG: hypothetical protein AMK69_04515 [Nitrospira bacterium SG8_3]